MTPLSQDELVRLANNPTRGTNLVINEIENNWFNGTVQLNSKSHPAVLMIDLILGTTHGFLNRLEDATSRKFLLHARNVSELSMNMADDERYGLFANPAESLAMVAMDIDTFNDIAVERSVTVGRNTVVYKELLIPKDTILPVNGYDFWVVNGVRIQFNERNGWKVTYDDSTNNPLIPISGNLLDRDFKVVDGRQYVMIYMPVKQMSCKAVENITSNEASGCRGTVEYKDYLYGVRAFLTNDTGTQEIRVSYDQDVFDPLTVTLALDIDTVNQRFAYEMPDVYIADGNERGRGTINLYAYTTKGELVKDLTMVSPTDIVPNYQDYRYGSGVLDQYSVPLRNAGGIAWQLIDVVRGGMNPTSFLDMKRRVIAGRQEKTLPITENNLIGAVQNYGYNPVKTIDYMTKRSYALTKELPIQGNKGFYAPLACYVGSHLTSIDNLVASGVVWDNGQRVTIPHNVLFNVNNPTSVLVNQMTKDQYLRYTPEQLVDLMEDNTLVYTPFYYVMDTTNNQVVLRTYHLDEPKMLQQTFVQDNPALAIEVGVGKISVTHEDDGYRITLVTKSGDSYKNLVNDTLGIQLSINPVDTASMASIPGQLVALDEEGERVWEFKLKTRWDIDVNDVLYFTNFQQFGSVQSNTGSALDVEMTFIFTRAGDKEITKSDIDDLIDDSIFSQPMVGIIETKYKVQLGQRLASLYSRIRPLIGEAQYKRHPADVPETYLTTEYLRINGQLQFDAQGNAIVEHKAGDIKYNADGSMSLLYRGGIDFVMVDGEYVELEPRFKQNHWDFIAFDANYMFSKDDYDIEFAQETKDFFVDVIGADMAAFTSQSLDNTALYYQPRSKLGYTRVVVNSNYESVLRQDLTFSVTYYLTESGFRNPNLRASLEASTPRQLNEALFGKTTISVSELTTALLQNVSEEVVTAKLSAIAGDTTVDVISNIDDLTGFSVRKRLELSSDGLVSVQEAIDITFQPHDVRMASTF
ncbi:hypothetical protein D3C81_424730 [compost metagenome]